MKQMHLSNETYAALNITAERNFRTVELQIAYWLAQEGEAVRPETLSKKIAISKKYPLGVTKRGNRNWSPEKRAQQRERMKQMWASGKIKPGRASGLDAAVGLDFDD